MIDRQTVKHLADLARIRLSDGEAEKLEGELGTILDYVKSLEQVDTTGITHEGVPGVLRNVWRDDKPSDDFLRSDPAAILENAPRRKDDYYSVKKVIDYGE